MGKTPFGAWLERQIEERDWTLTQAAKRIGLAQSNLSRYVNGDAAPGRKNLRVIAKAFDAGRDELEALLDAGRPKSTSPRPSPYASAQRSAIEDAENAADALADPRLPVAFYGLLDSWPDLTTDEQEDILATIAHRRDTILQRRREAEGNEDGDQARSRS